MKFLDKLIFTPYLRKVLVTRFNQHEIEEILYNTWKSYKELIPMLPIERSMAVRLALRTAAVAIGFYHAQVGAGASPEEAKQGVYVAACLLVDRSVAVPRALIGLSTRDPLIRWQRAVALFRKLVLSPRSFQMNELADSEREAAFEITRCPMAEYFAQQQLPELCQATFCNVDNLLAEKFGGVLERTANLAEGAERCSLRLRWVVQ